MNLPLTAKRETFLAQIRNGNFQSLNLKVYHRLLNSTGMTKQDLMRVLGAKHQTITSRLSYLQDLGAVRGVKLKREDDRTLTYYRAVMTISEMEKLAAIRHHEKLKSWLKRGEEEFGIKIMPDFSNPDNFQETLKNNFNQELFN